MAVQRRRFVCEETTFLEISRLSPRICISTTGAVQRAGRLAGEHGRTAEERRTLSMQMLHVHFL